MSSKKALIVWGGWDGHEPQQVGEHFADILRAESFEVDISNDMDAFLKSNDFDLIVPIVTMSKISGEQMKAVQEAVESGVGMAGCHGGMCDAFRECTEWQFLTGGQWVAHPGNEVTYMDNFGPMSHEITAGLSDFQVTSEQYYLHTDPGNVVLATTDFPLPGVDGPHTGNPCKMPQVWVKSFGKGRVFYNALGHNRAVFDQFEPTELMRRGFNWAARS